MQTKSEQPDTLKSSVINSTISDSIVESNELVVVEKKQTKSSIKKNKKAKNQDTKLMPEDEQDLIKRSDSDTSEISFYYGNPTVDIVKGFLHIYKDWLERN